MGIQCHKYGIPSAKVNWKMTGKVVYTGFCGDNVQQGLQKLPKAC